MSAEPSAAVRVENLSKTYWSAAGAVPVFTELTLTLSAGERVAVVGASGSGKSTLLHLLGALDRPSSGTVYFGDQDIFRLDDRALADFRNRAIGFVWQMNSLLPEFTALENTAMPLLIRGIGSEDARGQARERLDEVGLGHRIHHRAGELSGGEQQRVALARALVGRPQVLLADEPTGNLDYRTGQAVADLLSELHRHHLLTSVIVTHNLAFAQSCDRVLQLEEGRLDGRIYV